MDINYKPVFWRCVFVHPNCISQKTGSIAHASRKTFPKLLLYYSLWNSCSDGPMYNRRSLQVKLSYSARLKFHFFCIFHCVWMKTTCNSAVVRPTKYCVPPSCSPCDSALNDLIRNHQTWPPECPKQQIILRQAVICFKEQYCWRHIKLIHCNANKMVV